MYSFALVIKKSSNQNNFGYFLVNGNGEWFYDKPLMCDYATDMVSMNLKRVTLSVTYDL